VKAVVGANLTLRFLLELAALAAVGYWGWKTGDGALGWILAVAAVAAVIAVWALFVSPKHTVETSKPVSFAIELAVWVAAGAALYATDHAPLALAFVAISVISGLLNYVWR
jgi:Na+/melibiose symporter-like transporter